ncbi:hypothetical protein QN277_022892 [Acacia crassicarpa]|uniref:Uncharacterized protein n=1 Tax=Acacia crassicarpa TaxID=499986 RepID=A0AAE1KCA6_9FABA|nr:hypothetical protein QN277_022892 [Acacia crassicarpa]
MSLTYLLLLFLCFSFHSCDARCLTGFSNKKSHLYPKSVDLSLKQLASQKNGEDEKKTGIIVAEAEKPKVTNIRTSNKRVLEVKKGKTGSLKFNESLVSVPWRVPREKKGDKNPGFNLDYSPPKTHPPSHN